MSKLKITRGLIIKENFLDLIFACRKTWEIRGADTHVHGPIAMIQSGSGCIVGTCELIGTKGPLMLNEYKNNYRKIGIAKKDDIKKLPYNRTYAWIMAKAKRLKRPLPYKHPQGAVIWVKLAKSATNKL